MAERLLAPERGVGGDSDARVANRNGLPAFFHDQTDFAASSTEDEALEPESSNMWEDANHASPEVKPAPPGALPSVPLAPLSTPMTSVSASMSCSSLSETVYTRGSVSGSSVPAPAMSALSRSFNSSCSVSKVDGSTRGDGSTRPSSGGTSALASSSLNPSSAPFFSSAESPYTFAPYSSPAPSPSSRTPVSPLPFSAFPIDSAASSSASLASLSATFPPLSSPTSAASKSPSYAFAPMSSSAFPFESKPFSSSSSPTFSSTSPSAPSAAAPRGQASMKPYSASYNGLSPRARPFSIGPPPGFSAPPAPVQDEPVSMHLRPPASYPPPRLHSDLGVNLQANQSALQLNQSSLASQTKSSAFQASLQSTLQSNLQAIQAQIAQFQSVQHQLPLASQQQLVQLVLQQQQILLQQQQQQQVAEGFFPSVTITAPPQAAQSEPFPGLTVNPPPNMSIGPPPGLGKKPGDASRDPSVRGDPSLRGDPSGGARGHVDRDMSAGGNRPHVDRDPSVRGGNTREDPSKGKRDFRNPTSEAGSLEPRVVIDPPAAQRQTNYAFARSSSDPSLATAAAKGETGRGEKDPSASLRDKETLPATNPGAAPSGDQPRIGAQFQQWKARDAPESFNNFDRDLGIPAPVTRARSTPTPVNVPIFSPGETVSADDLDPTNPMFQSPSVANLLNHVKYVKSLNTSPVLDDELVRQSILVQIATLQAQQTRTAMQAVLQQPEAAESAIGAATMAAHAAATNLAAQQLQYLQTAALRGQIDPATMPAAAGVASADFVPLTTSFSSSSASTSPVPSPASSPRWEMDHPSSPKGHRSYGSGDGSGSGGGYSSNLDSSQRGGGDGSSRRRGRGGDDRYSNRGTREGSPSPSQSPTSSSLPWLEAFRAAKGMDQLSLKEVVVRGWLKDLATDQCGSRFLQRRLEAASAEHKQLAFEQLIQTGILPLCTDVFGNYVVQKFFEYGGAEHRTTLASKLLGNVVRLSMQMYGCRVVQKAIELAEPPVQIQLVKELEGHVMECVKDQNGNHVIQKCLEKVPPSKIDFILDAFKGQVSHLATHPYGCRVIQRYIQTCVPSESEPEGGSILDPWTPRQEDALVNELLGDHTDELCRNQYGNYVIQHLLVHGSPWQRSGITHALLGKLLVLSKHKFASNVVEKCFVYGSHQDRTLLIQEVLGRHADGSCPLLVMVRDQYANYVVQKMIDVCDQDQLAMIVQRIKRHVPGLRKIPYGKNILTRLEKLTGTVFSGTNQHGSDAFPNSEQLASPSSTIPFPGTADFNPAAAGGGLNMNPWPPILGNSPAIARRFWGPDSPTHNDPDAAGNGNGNSWSNVRGSWSSMEGRSSERT